MNIDKLEKLIRRYKELSKGQDKPLQDMFFAEIPEMVYNSNAIENSTLTLKDTEDIIFREIIKKDHEMREIYEAINLAKITEQLIDRPDDKLSLQLILDWHKVLLSRIDEGIAGRFRSGDEWVRVGGHVGANPHFTSGMMSELINEYNTDDKTYFIDKIAYFHAQFELIHPFCDGNGRIGRALINQQLVFLGLPPVIIQNKGKRTDYYPLFTKFEQTDDYSGFSRLLTLLLSESLNKRIATFASPKITTVNKWASDNNIRANTALTKAKRQAIPAFRKGGKWMIAAEYKEGENV